MLGRRRRSNKRVKVTTSHIVHYIVVQGICKKNYSMYLLCARSLAQGSEENRGWDMLGKWRARERMLKFRAGGWFCDENGGGFVYDGRRRLVGCDACFGHQ